MEWEEREREREDKTQDNINLYIIIANTRTFYTNTNRSSCCTVTPSSVEYISDYVLLYLFMKWIGCVGI